MTPTIKSLNQSFDLYDDLLTSLSDDGLNQKLPVPSNRLWDQLWCVVGVRESVTKALESGEWQGFSCSLTSDDRGKREPLEQALTASRGLATALAEADPDHQLVLNLLLHEVQHQGQIIRYLYGLDLEIPPSWQRRWSL